MKTAPDGAAPDACLLGERLNGLLRSLGEVELGDALALRFGAYAALLMRWNARTNLSAIRDEDGILRRHFAECIVCARALPPDTGTLLDYGSGAGFPGLCISLCRDDIAVTLAESQGKKAAFLREAVRILDVPVEVHGGRAELVGRLFGCVALRAVDRMSEAVRKAGDLVGPRGYLAILTTTVDSAAVPAWAGHEFVWEKPVAIAGSLDRILLQGRRSIVPRGTIGQS